MKENTGLIVWGTKNGWQEFFCSPHLSIRDSSTAAAINDVRGMPLLIYRPGRYFYALEFTPNYIIASYFRSIHDWIDRDGYLAISILIPHNIRFQEGQVMTSLKKMMDIYEQRYIRGEKIEGKNENPNLFLDQLPVGAGKGAGYNALLSETTKGKFAVIKFKEEQEVSYFFNDPYRTAFAPYKTIFFLSSNETGLGISQDTVLLDLPAKRVQYTLFVTVKELESGREINLPVQFKINERAFTDLVGGRIEYLEFNDEIFFVVEEKGYQATETPKLSVAKHIQGADLVPYVLFVKKKNLRVELHVLDENKRPTTSQLPEVKLNGRNITSLVQEGTHFAMSGFVGDEIEVTVNKSGYQKLNDKTVIQNYDIVDGYVLRIWLTLIPLDPKTTNVPPRPSALNYGDISRVEGLPAVEADAISRYPVPFWEKPLVIVMLLVFIGALSGGIYHLLNTGPISNVEDTTSKTKSWLKINEKELKRPGTPIDSLTNWKKKYDALESNIFLTSEPELKQLFNSNKGRIDSLIVINSISVELKEMENFIRDGAFFEKAQNDKHRTSVFKEYLNTIKAPQGLNIKIQDMKGKIDTLIDLEDNLATYKKVANSPQIRKKAVEKLTAAKKNNTWLNQKRKSQIP